MAFRVFRANDAEWPVGRGEGAVQDVANAWREAAKG
jgi:hypothetical protein